MTRPNPSTPGPNLPAKKKRTRVRTDVITSVEGALPVRVLVPEAYTGNPRIDFDAGPFHLALLDKDAVFSLAEGLYELLRIGRHIYPDLDRFLKLQRLARVQDRHEEVDPEARARVNGGLTNLEKAMLKAHAKAEIEPVPDLDLGAGL